MILCLDVGNTNIKYAVFLKRIPNKGGGFSAAKKLPERKTPYKTAFITIMIYLIFLSQKH